MGVAPTGNGRRESYAHLPMPRMTNTFMLAGQDDPADIVRSVDRGIYAVNFGGGQVDITSGKFVFSASEAYRIEDGRVGAPLKGATLIGNGPDVLTRVSRIGQRPRARSRGRHVRQGRPVGAGRGRHADDPDRRSHGRRHRGMSELAGAVELALASALRAGAAAPTRSPSRPTRSRRACAARRSTSSSRRASASSGVRALVRGARGTRSAITSTSDLGEPRCARSRPRRSRSRAPPRGPRRGPPRRRLRGPERLPALELGVRPIAAVRARGADRRGASAPSAPRRRSMRADRELEGSSAVGGFARVAYAVAARGFVGDYAGRPPHSIFARPIARANGTCSATTG
jgi:predicted Zn-dependent protease